MHGSFSEVTVAAQGWSIAGTRVEFRAAFPAGKLAVLDASGKPTHELKLSQTGEWPLEIGARKFRVVRTKQFLTPKLEILSGQGELVPPSVKHLSPGAAPPGSLCPQHAGTPAALSCARCGTFMCDACQGADVTHCRTCIGALVVEAERNAAALKWMAPAFVFIPLFGLLGGLIGVAAGGATYAVARRTEKKAIKVAAAVVFYGLALVIMIVLAAVISSARE